TGASPVTLGRSGEPAGEPGRGDRDRPGARCRGRPHARPRPPRGQGGRHLVGRDPGAARARSALGQTAPPGPAVHPPPPGEPPPQARDGVLLLPAAAGAPGVHGVRGGRPDLPPLRGARQRHRGRPRQAALTLPGPPYGPPAQVTVSRCRYRSSRHGSLSITSASAVAAS